MMPTEQLTREEKTTLLIIARQALEIAVCGEKLPRIDPQTLTSRLRRPGASFVTLTMHGELRGCVGTLDAYQSLADDVQDHAMAAALQDYRFPPVQAQELQHIHMEISVLSQPQPIEYDTPQELPGKLRPGVDGVVLIDGMRRSTFLPQVWESLPDPVQFLDHLCHKMGAAPDLWQRRKLVVRTYQVEEFHEPKLNS